jgi:hypothetical protein
LVGGDCDGVLLLALGEDLEEELGAAAVEFHVAELVDHEEVDAAVPGDRLGELLVVGGLDEFVDQFRGQDVADPVAVFGGCGAQGDEQGSTRDLGPGIGSIKERLLEACPGGGVLGRL